MLERTLSFLADQLNAHLGARYPSSEPHAVLSSLIGGDGTVPSGIENKVVLSLVNIEREVSAAGSGTQLRAEGEGFIRTNAPLNLNLYILAAASFAGNYDEALKLLSAVLGFFQGRQVFTVQNVAGFPRGLEKLTLEIVNLDLQGLNNLWGNIGGKYLPSVLYKARMLTVQEGWILDQVPGISGTDTTI
jgi:hypothetical protein